MKTENIHKAYDLAREKYAEIGVDTDQAMKKLANIRLSIHCWQGDDVHGFEKKEHELAGSGLQVTGSYPGRAGTVEELRQDLEKVYSLLPGKHRLNLHALYGEFGKKSVDRDAIGPEHFQGWLDWSLENGLLLDFNASCFSHPKADSGSTLSSKDESIRKFWIEHVKRCREISAWMGKKQNSASVHNLWIPDGCKDAPMNRMSIRKRLKESLDSIFAVKYPSQELVDAVESKLFGIGSESFVAGSHEFYMGYALKNNLALCLDTGHFHPTESIADKISSLLLYMDKLLIHVSRGVRWDSDHIVLMNDEIVSLMREIVRSNSLDRVYLGLDFFDASVNRIGAWVTGGRAALRSLLFALLEPAEKMEQYENTNNNFGALALRDEEYTFPVGAVWDQYCLQNSVPSGNEWIENIMDYEKSVLNRRNR